MLAILMLITIALLLFNISLSYKWGWKYWGCVFFLTGSYVIFLSYFVEKHDLGATASGAVVAALMFLPMASSYLGLFIGAAILIVRMMKFDSQQNLPETKAE